MRLEVVENVWGEFREQLGTHVCVWMETRSGPSEEGTHVGNIGSQRSAKEFVEGQAAAVDVKHINEGSKGGGTCNGVRESAGDEVREMRAKDGERESMGSEGVGIGLSGDEPKVEARR